MSRRTQKVEELLREEASKLVQSELADKIGIVTLTRVIVTPDLRLAQIYFTSITGENIKILQSLNESKTKIQNLIARKLTLRNTPKIIFKIDEGSQEIDRIEKLLKDIDNAA